MNVAPQLLTPAQRAQKRRRHSLHLALLALLVLLTMLYILFVLARVPYGSAGPPVMVTRAQVPWRVEPVDIIELEDGGGIALSKRSKQPALPPTTHHPRPATNGGDKTGFVAVGDLHHTSSPAKANAIAQPLSPHHVAGTQLNGADPSGAVGAGGSERASRNVVDSDSDEFPNIHTHPLQSKRRQLELQRGNTDVVGNSVLELYRSVTPSSRDNAFFEHDREFWKDYPQLEMLVRKFQTINEEMRAGKRPRRFVTVSPMGQLCNRLVAISSAFLFALLTRRSLQVDDTGFYAQSADLFEEPGFDWLSAGPGDGNGNGNGWGGHDRFSHDLEVLQNPESGVWEHTEKLLCSDYQESYITPHVHFNVNQYLVPYMTNNPSYRRAILELFRGEDVFHPLQRFLFRPIRHLRDQRDAFVRKNFAGHFVVGLQVRSGPDFTSNFMSSADWLLYKNCALAATPREKRRDIKFFVATDTEEGREAATRELGAENVLFGPGPFLRSNNPRGVQMALLDIMLLAAADDRVTTAWSSYGYFGAGMAGLPANMVVDLPGVPLVAPRGSEQRFMGVPHKSDRRRQCVRLPTAQPCFHKFASWGAATARCFRDVMFEREMLGGRYC